MQDTPFDISQQPPDTTPFGDAPIGPSGVPRITIRPQASTPVGSSVGVSDNAPAGVDTGSSAAPTGPLDNGAQQPTKQPDLSADDIAQIDANKAANAPKVQPQGKEQTAPSNLGGLVSSAQAQEVSTPGAEVTNDPTPDDLKAIQQNIMHGEMATDKRIGSPMNIAKAFDEPIVNMLSAGLSHSMQGAAAEAGNSTSDPEFAKKMSALGEEYMRNPNKPYVDAQEFFYKIGITPPDPNTYMTDAGHQVWNTIATSLAMAYGASSLATTMAARGISATGAGSATQRAIQMVADKYSKAIAANPQMWATAEMLSGAGATVGGEMSQDYAEQQGKGALGKTAANFIGSIGGGMVGGGSAFITTKVAGATMRLSKFALRQIGNVIDSLTWWPNNSKILQNKGMPQIPSFKGSGAPPPVDEDTLNAARQTETHAREASQAVEDARVARDKQARGTGDYAVAHLSMLQKLEEERGAHSAADSAWNMVPKEARGRLSRQQQAIRSKFADTVYPKQFANAQVEGERDILTKQIQDVFDKIEPSDISKGPAGYSRDISEGLWGARTTAKGILNKYWNRAPLNKRMPDRSILKSVDGFINGLQKQGFNEDQIPYKEIEKIQGAFGNIQNPTPTLGWMKNFMTGLHEEANRLYANGSNIMASNYDKLHSAMYSVASKAFPDNVPLQQARATSKQYFDLFTRSELGRYLNTTKQGGVRIHEEDVLKGLFERARGFKDLNTAMTWLDKNGALPTNIKDPDYLSKAQRANIDKLRQNAQDGIRSMVQDFMSKVESDPGKVQKFLNNPQMLSRIKTMGNTSAELKGAAQDLKGLIDKRNTLEKSSFAKYAESGDPDKALDIAWRSDAPTVRSMMDGTSGIGGFRSDPMAMRGFQAGMIDRFLNETGGDPSQMIRMLQSPKGRILQETMSKQEWDRFNSLVNRTQEIVGEQAAHEKSNKFKTLLAQMLSLKALAYVPEFLHPGEGGSLKFASLVSATAKDAVETFTHEMNPKDMFREALTNPEFEQALYKRVPASVEEAKELAKVLRRSAIVERGMWGFYQNWYAYGNGPSEGEGNDPTNTPLSWLVGKANASPTQTGQDFNETSARIFGQSREHPENPQPTSPNGGGDYTGRIAMNDNNGRPPSNDTNDLPNGFGGGGGGNPFQMTRAKSGPQVMPAANKNVPLEDRVSAELANRQEAKTNATKPLTPFERQDFQRYLGEQQAKPGETFKEALDRIVKETEINARRNSFHIVPGGSYKSATDQLRDWSKER